MTLEEQLRARGAAKARTLVEGKVRSLIDQLEKLDSNDVMAYSVTDLTTPNGSRASAVTALWSVANGVIARISPRYEQAEVNAFMEKVDKLGKDS